MLAKAFNATKFELATNGNGKWMKGTTEVASITLPGDDADAPTPDSTTGAITYTGIDGASHTVTPTADAGSEFKSCAYNPATRTFTATFEESAD